uniref:PLA2c domain-containing protein n=1 Tax=Knipowitschia caucasica TaxID=637954 RepID=A0AAV2JT76_KNICA
MSVLYQDENWSNNLDTIIRGTRDQLTKTVMSGFTISKIKYYRDQMEQKETQGHQTNSSSPQMNSSTLSEQQKTVSRGQNPLPIYTAVNVKEAIDGHLPENEWVEFSPFSVGIQKYGAFIKAENFGSEFFLGHLLKKLPELRLPFLIGEIQALHRCNVRRGPGPFDPGHSAPQSRVRTRILVQRILQKPTNHQRDVQLHQRTVPAPALQQEQLLPVLER